MRHGLILALALAACSPSGAPASERPDAAAAVEASRAFQRGYEAALREDPTSFLTTVAAVYLAPGDQLGLGRSDRGWAAVEASPELALQAAAEALTIRRGDEILRFAEPGELELDDRFRLTISRQEADWRVLIHDRDAERRASFPGIAWFPVDARFIVEARFSAATEREPILLQTSRGVSKTLHLAGEAEFELDGAELTLKTFAYAPEPAPGEPLLIPFRDATSGEQSYAAGRYLELEAPAPGAALTLDFNRATNPLCAYSEHYNCPLPPRFNVLDVAIEAGAMDPH